MSPVSPQAAPVDVSADADAAIADAAIADAAIAEALLAARQLATLPEVTQEIMRLADDPATTGDDLAAVLRRDPSLSARVLKVVNSAIYGVRREVTSVDGAVVVLGFGAVKNIAIAAGFSRLFRGQRVGGGFTPRDLWTHSIATAAASQRLARRTGAADPSDALLAGLLHDIGLILALQGAPRRWDALAGALEADPALAFADAERTHLGAPHTDYGDALCAQWGFPASLRAVVRCHHDPDAVTDETLRPLVALVHVADALAAATGTGLTRTVPDDAPGADACALIGVTPAIRDELASTIAEDVAALLPQLNGE
jgi:HD-like signal output (HDOD) protein